MTTWCGAAVTTLCLGRKKARAGRKKAKADRRRHEAVLRRRFLRGRAVPPRDAVRFRLAFRVTEAERQETACAGASPVGPSPERYRPASR